MTSDSQAGEEGAIILISKLTLGTVQLGTRYGINNKSGQPSLDESMEILEYAYKNSITSIDTAAAYGESEKVIGEWMKTHKKRKEFITTKIAPIAKNGIKDNIRDYVRKCATDSIKKLNISSIDNYMIHDFHDLEIYQDQLFCALVDLKENNIVSKIGCSIYDISCIETLQKYNFDTIQLPASIFSQGILESKELMELKETGVKVFVRSAFVQGLIFCQQDNLPPRLKEIAPYINRLNDIAASTGCSKVHLAISFLLNHKNVDSVLVGVETKKQLKEIIIEAGTTAINNDTNLMFKEFREIPTNLVDPRNWN